MKPKDLLALILLGALWGGSFLFIRVGAPVLGPLVLMELRVGVAATVLALYCSLRKSVSPMCTLFEILVTHTPSVRSIEPPRLSIASMTGRIVRAGVG